VSDGWLARDSRHEEVGRNEAPGEPRPPGLPSLIEGHASKILDVTILSYAFASEEIAQAVSERGHRRALTLELDALQTRPDSRTHRGPRRLLSTPLFLASPLQPPLVCHEVPTVSHEKHHCVNMRVHR
jgi:hypothetical protein